MAAVYLETAMMSCTFDVLGVLLDALTLCTAFSTRTTHLFVLARVEW